MSVVVILLYSPEVYAWGCCKRRMKNTGFAINKSEGADKIEINIRHANPSSPLPNATDQRRAPAHPLELIVGAV